MFLIKIKLLKPSLFLFACVHVVVGRIKMHARYKTVFYKLHCYVTVRQKRTELNTICITLWNSLMLCTSVVHVLNISTALPRVLILYVSACVKMRYISGRICGATCGIWMSVTSRVNSEIKDQKKNKIVLAILSTWAQILKSRHTLSQVPDIQIFLNYSIRPTTTKVVVLPSSQIFLFWGRSDFNFFNLIFTKEIFMRCRIWNKY